jgi:hypothetical protein
MKVTITLRQNESDAQAIRDYLAEQPQAENVNTRLVQDWLQTVAWKIEDAARLQRATSAA